MRVFGPASHSYSFGLVGLFALFCGCGSNDFPFVAKNDFAEQYAAAICDELAPCCASAALAYDAAGCRRHVTEALAPKLSDPALVYDPAAAAACVLAAEDGSRSCFEEGAYAYVAACARVLTGTLVEGAACTAASQCAVPLRGGHAACDAGKCVVVKAGYEGDPCAFTCTKVGGGERCWSTTASVSPDAPICFTGTGLFCLDGRCAPLARIGDPCTSGGCLDGAFCGPDGRCAPRGAVGAACASDDACAIATYCRDQACAELERDGASCTSGNACKSGHCAAGLCGASTSITAATCGGAPAIATSADAS
jgi:hypothetical protein